MSELPKVGAVLLSMGNRRAELAKALDGLHAQQGVELDIVLVGNGWEPEGIPDWVRTVYLKRNLGATEGRNVGAAEVRGDLIFFFDDDASIPSTDVLARMAEVFQNPAVAVCQCRVTDPQGLPTPRRWVPRVRQSQEGHGGEVTVFIEGVVMIRRTAFEEVGGWPGHFFFAHEAIDMAMQLMDNDWQVRYEPDIIVNHPATPASRHDFFLRVNSRNRVWVARRNLPAILVPVYCLSWVLITVLRIRQPAALKTWFQGFIEGWRSEPGPRKPIKWRTVWKMTKLGRPPIF